VEAFRSTLSRGRDQERGAKVLHHFHHFHRTASIGASGRGGNLMEDGNLMEPVGRVAPREIPCTRETPCTFGNPMQSIEPAIGAEVRARHAPSAGLERGRAWETLWTRETLWDLSGAPRLAADSTGRRIDAMTTPSDDGARTMTPKDLDGLSAQLRAHVRGSGLSMLAVARGSEIDPAALSRFLSGERGLRLDALDRLTAFLRLRLVAPRSTKGRKR